jgi:ABC-type branched-subunit amino acid transport system ATPase component
MVREVSDRVAVLDWGECLMVDKPAVVAADERVVAAYLGVDEDSLDDVPDLEVS